VLANDFRDYHYHYPGARVITGVTQSQHGGVVTISANGRNLHYQPAVDFHGEDFFTYTVDGYTTAGVAVEVIRRVRDDQFRVDAEDGQQRLPVLVNDLFGANYARPGQISGVSATTAGGTVSIGDDGHSILYTPASGFVGTDTFIYTVDGALKAEVKIVVDAPAVDQTATFGSLESYFQFLLEDALTRYEHLFGKTAWPGWFSSFNGMSYSDADDTAVAASTRNHSETNVQVAGVDEGDIVEFDDEYVYTLTDGELVIVNAWPANELSIASRVEIEGRPIAQFLHGNRLTVISEIGGYFGNQYSSYSDVYDVDRIDIGDCFRPWQPALPPKTIVTVLDISDRTAPTIVQKTEMEGKYVDSRGVGDFVYVLVNNVNAVGQAPRIIDEDDNPDTPGRYESRDEYVARVAANSGEFVESALPNYTTYGADGEMVRTGLLNSPEGIYQPLVVGATSLISVVSFNVESDEPGLADTSAVYSTGASTVYASLNNFYVLDGDTSDEDGAITRIVKFDWEPSTGGIEFAATTTVAGTIINQFSMDESGENLRIATTVSNSRSGNWSWRGENMLFVLQEDNGVFEFVGSLQNLALDESIRSVRFLGNRAFVTTFRDVDPLFAIDLSDPGNPKSVGHITLPGFTSYMHLIDENHLLTVGKNTPRGEIGPTQVSLFDISDLSQPRRIAEYTFDRFTTSEAEIDHHAFGYYAEHGLLGMPIAQEHVERVDLDGDGYRETRRIVRENLLAVFSVDANSTDPGSRLVLSGEIEHDTQVRRSGYIADKLYSISKSSVKVVDVTSPSAVLAQVAIDDGSDGFDNIHATPIFVPTRLGETGLIVLTEKAPAEQNANPLDLATEAARNCLADYLGIEAGAPMLVTAEVAPSAPSGSYHLVFRVGDRNYAYRADANGKVELADDNFAFATTAAWHAVSLDWPNATSIIDPGAGTPGQGVAGGTSGNVFVGAGVGEDMPVQAPVGAANPAFVEFPNNIFSRMKMRQSADFKPFTSAMATEIDSDLLFVLAQQSNIGTAEKSSEFADGTRESVDSAADELDDIFAILGETLNCWES
jgi:uncharacterized secreted protein with C-terminal beta-propeller domain